MLKAYYDESGIHDGASCCVVAGYFGGPGQWKRLETQWRAVLKRNGIKEFHAQRFFTRANGKRVGEYQAWSDSQADQFIDELVSIVEHSTKIHPASCVVVKEEWNNRTYGERQFLTGGIYRAGKFKAGGAPSKAYFVPFQFAILNAALHCGIGQKTDFIFDLNEQFKGYAQQLYALLKGEAPGFSPRTKARLGRLTFDNSVDAIPIQVADLFTYLSAGYGAEKVGNKDAEPQLMLRRLIRNLLDKDDHVFLNKEGIEIALEHCPNWVKVMQKPTQEKKKVGANTGGNNKASPALPSGHE